MNEFDKLKGSEIMRRTGCKVGAHVWTHTSGAPMASMKVVVTPNTGSPAQLYPLAHVRCNCGLMTWAERARA